MQFFASVSLAKTASLPVQFLYATNPDLRKRMINLAMVEHLDVCHNFRLQYMHVTIQQWKLITHGKTTCLLTNKQSTTASVERSIIIIQWRQHWLTLLPVVLSHGSLDN